MCSYVNDVSVKRALLSRIIAQSPCTIFPVGVCFYLARFNLCCRVVSLQFGFVIDVYPMTTICHKIILGRIVCTFMPNDD